MFIFLASLLMSNQMLTLQGLAAAMLLLSHFLKEAMLSRYSPLF